MSARSDHLSGVLSVLREPEIPDRQHAHIIIGVQACRCCGHGAIRRDLIAAVLQLADLVDADLALNSGYRCAKHNAAVGGSPRSRHLTGDAVDIAVPEGMEPLDFYRAALQVSALERGGIGVDAQRRFVHLDFGKRRRWAYHDGRECAWSAVFPAEA